VRVKYLSPTQARVTNSNGGLGVHLAEASLTLGYFKFHDTVQVWWSQDHRQRAESTFMNVLSSINSNAYELGAAESQSYSPDVGDLSGVIEINLNGAWWALDLAVSIGLIVAAHAIPDIAPPFGGPTIPVGSIARSIATINMLRVLAHLGVGRYEILGTTYDYVDQVNEVEAYDQDAPAWQTKVEEIQNDLISNDTVAQGLAVNELLYRSRAAVQGGLTMADDLRVEPGDVIGTADGRRLYVQSYSRDLSRGAPATLELGGFWI
jgi:hypothetical protein